jgi:dUTP pyrophosphatase
MNVKIKRIDKNLPLPEYQTKGAAAFDLYSRIDMEIKPGEIALVPTNLVVETPMGYGLFLAPRSSTPRKKGLMMPHSLGIVDPDYSGEEDEVMLQYKNFTSEVVKIEKGERIGQAFFVETPRVTFTEVDKMDNENRGGFGSTGA